MEMTHFSLNSQEHWDVSPKEAGEEGVCTEPASLRAKEMSGAGEGHPMVPLSQHFRPAEGLLLGQQHGPWAWARWPGLWVPRVSGWMTHQQRRRPPSVRSPCLARMV